MNKYKALRDFGVSDETSPIYGSHVAGSTVDTLTDEQAQAFVENGDLELVSDEAADEAIAEAGSESDEKEEETEVEPEA